MLTTESSRKENIMNKDNSQQASLNSKHNHIGGWQGYWLRRLIHLATLFIPIIYYFYLPEWNFFSITTLHYALMLFAILVLILEIFRIKHGWIIIGQRDYEKNQISGLAWSVFGITIILLLTPRYGVGGAAYGLPLVWCFALVDPIIGEARNYRLSKFQLAQAGILITSLIWLGSFWWLDTPWQIIPFVVPITVASEMIKIPYVDDNANILIIPLLLVLAFQYLF